VDGINFESSAPDFDPSVAVLFLALETGLTGFGTSFFCSQILAAATRAEVLVGLRATLAFGLEIEVRESVDSSVSSLTF
jgi:hypothetical protein